jgi:hypothetical protein
MDREDLLELIHRQILEVETQLSAQIARGERTERTVGLLRSLRLTLQALSAGIEPEDEAASTFVLSVSETGQLLLRKDNRLVALSGPFFRSLLTLAGISLVSGEVLLVEPEFARRAIEDSLGQAVAEESRLERRRAELGAALQQSASESRDPLLSALGEIDEREADLLLEKIDLAELNLIARMLSDGVPSDEPAPAAE